MTTPCVGWEQALTLRLKLRGELLGLPANDPVQVFSWEAVSEGLPIHLLMPVFTLYGVYPPVTVTIGIYCRFSQ